MTRRDFLGSSAAAALWQPQGRCTMGIASDSFAVSRPPRTALEMMEQARKYGAGGVQATLASFEPAYLKQVRQRVEEWGLYLEISAPLPVEDTAQFENTLKAAKEVGALCLRSVCLSGRRYETFATLEKWREFVATSKVRLAKAVPLADQHRVAIGLENHKDWTAEEMPALLRSYSSEYLGACIDFGNNVSLLDDPLEFVEALAPFAVNTHIKDMGVEEYEEGFLLSEVPLGQGVLDLKKMVAVIGQARPKVRHSLEMITRDPLKVTCLTPKYWVAFPERNGKYLAKTLSMVRSHKPAKPLPVLSAMPKEERLKLEAEYLTECVRYARDVLGMRG